LYVWASLSGISKIGDDFEVSTLAAGISLAGAIMAALSYFVAPESQRNNTVYAAYWLLLGAITALTLQTGETNSPFIALWLVAAIFAGIFGTRTIGMLFIGLNAYVAIKFFDGGIAGDQLLGIILAGELPIIVSYILWHGKSRSEQTKERAYYDLANELSQVSNKSEVVINAISDGVIAINNKGIIELINPAAQRIVGWGNQDALNLDYKSVLQLLTSDGHEVDKSNDPVFDVLSTNQPNRRNDLQLQTSSGKKIMIDVVVSPIGRLGSGAIIVFRDITKQQAEEKAQTEFISTASHEMRTPVASIEGYLGLALNPATATIDAKARDFITKAHEAAEHLGHLFQDLLDVTKADDGRLSNNPKVIDVVQFTDDIVTGLRPKAEEKKIRLFFKPTTSEDGGMRNLEPVFFVNLDADHLREVLANLVENAIKYTPAGEVVIDVQGDDSHVVVSIADSGIGIPTEDIPHLFQKFYRVDNSDTREIGGTGLGLYLCRKLIEAMGGRIWVDSEYKKGSTFSVELPRISHQEANRLIEAASNETIQQDVRDKYIGDETGDTPTEAERAQALGTPLILNRSTPVSQATPAVAAQVAEAVPDQLVGGTAPAAPTAEPLRPQNGTVLPPNLQAIPSNLQTAPQPSPVAAPAPAPAPIPTSVPQPNNVPRAVEVPKR
jgi:PAS domain S-box-containing protein